MVVPCPLKLSGAGEGTRSQFEGVGSIPPPRCSIHRTHHPKIGSVTFHTSSPVVWPPQEPALLPLGTRSPKGPGPPALVPLVGKQNKIPYNQPASLKVVIAPVEDF